MKVSSSEQRFLSKKLFIITKQNDQFVNLRQVRLILRKN